MEARVTTESGLVALGAVVKRIGVLGTGYGCINSKLWIPLRLGTAGAASLRPILHVSNMKRLAGFETALGTSTLQIADLCVRVIGEGCTC